MSDTKTVGTNELCALNESLFIESLDEKESI